MTWLLRIAMAVVLIVGAIAAVVSYSHMQELAAGAGEGWRSYLIPLSVDGLIVAAGMVLAVRRQMGLPGGKLAWSGLGLGIVASIAANMADARPEVTAILVAGWAPVAFAWTFELIQQLRRLSTQPDATDAPGSTGSAPPPPAQPPSAPVPFGIDPDGNTVSLDLAKLVTPGPAPRSASPSGWPAPGQRTQGPGTSPRSDRPAERPATELPVPSSVAPDWRAVGARSGLAAGQEGFHSKDVRGNGAGPTYKGVEGAAQAPVTPSPGPVPPRPGATTPPPGLPGSGTPGQPGMVTPSEPSPVTPKPSSTSQAAPDTPGSTQQYPRPVTSHSPPGKRPGPPVAATAQEILEALEHHQGTISELASLLRVSESSIYRAKRTRTNGHEPVGAR